MWLEIDFTIIMKIKIRCSAVLSSASHTDESPTDLFFFAKFPSLVNRELCFFFLNKKFNHFDHFFKIQKSKILRRREIGILSEKYARPMKDSCPEVTKTLVCNNEI